MNIVSKFMNFQRKKSESHTWHGSSLLLLVTGTVLGAQQASTAGLMTSRDGSPALVLAEQDVSVVISPTTFSICPSITGSRYDDQIPV